MATTKTTTKKAPATKASNTNTNTNANAALQAEVNALREELATLRNQIASLSTASPVGDTSNMVTKDQLATALRSMGAREWVISKVGLR